MALEGRLVRCTPRTPGILEIVGPLTSPAGTTPPCTRERRMEFSIFRHAHEQFKETIQVTGVEGL
jgi:hypothetical protein